MTTDEKERGVLLIGKSQRVLAESVAGLRKLGYDAHTTDDPADVTDRFDARALSVVVFGGQVPPDRKAALQAEISAINPQITFVQGLSGIPGLLINQVQATFAADPPDRTTPPTFVGDERSILLALADPAEVNVTIWWGTSFVPPDPRSDSLVLLDDRLAPGEHAIRIPDRIPAKAVFATVHVGAAIYAFSVSTEQ
jgi:hypothetical protein